VIPKKELEEKIEVLL